MKTTSMDVQEPEPVPLLLLTLGEMEDRLLVGEDYISRLLPITRNLVFPSACDGYRLTVRFSGIEPLSLNLSGDLRPLEPV